MSGSPSNRHSRNELLLEAIVSQLRWFSAPGIPGLDAREDRLANPFARVKVILRSIMFQVAFLDLFMEAYHATGVEALDRSYGFPEAGIPEKMVEKIKEIYRVNSWDGFFAKVRYGKPTPPEFLNEIPDVAESTAEAYDTRASRFYGGSQRRFFIREIIGR